MTSAEYKHSGHPLLILIGFCFLALPSIQAQNPNAISDLVYYTDTSGKLTIRDIADNKYDHLFRPPQAVRPLPSKYIHWIKFSVHPPPNDDRKQFLWIPYVYMAYLYQGKNRIPLNVLSPDQSYYAEYKQGAGEDHIFYLKADNRFGQRSPDRMFPLVKLVDEDGLSVIKQESFFKLFQKNIFKSVFLVTALFLFVFTLFQWLINRQNVFLHYAAYLFCICIFYILRTGHVLGLNFEWLGWSREILSRWFSFGIMVGYILFVVSFLSLNPKDHPRVLAFLKTSVALYFTATLLYTLFSCLGKIQTSIQVYFLIRDLAVVIGGPALIYFVVKLNNALSRIILAGTLVLFVMMVIALVNEQSIRLTGQHIEFRGASYAQYGILLELLIFSIGLGYRTKLIQNENINTQRDLIVQLQKNESLQSELNKKLQLEKEKLEIEKKLGQAELRLLKAQINPHFLFNSFNALKDLIRQNKTEEADQYLGRFTRMMRGVLNSSDTQLHSLAQELEFSENYVQLEALRFAKPLQLEIHSDKESLEQPVPTLILQPLLENAIWHGLLHNEGEKKLEIRTKLSGDALIIEVMDNGTGPGPDLKINGNSFGLRLVQDRLKIQYPASSLEILDRKGDGGGEHGVLVRIEIPVTEGSRGEHGARGGH